MSFARKAVQWDQEDVKAAAAVLRVFEWNAAKAVVACQYMADRRGFAESYCTTSIVQQLLQRLDWDTSAAESLLIFVNEFRCLIEGADPPTEGTSNVSAESTPEGNHSDR
jgi:hypothetical protein